MALASSTFFSGNWFNIVLLLDEVVGVLQVNLGEKVLQAESVLCAYCHHVVPVRQFHVLEDLTLLDVGDVAFIGYVDDLLALFHLLANILAIFERLQVVDVEYQEDHIGPAYVVLIHLKEVIVLARRLFLKLRRTQEVPNLVLMDKLFAYDALGKDVAVLVRCLLDVDTLALIKVHVPEKQASLADILRAEDNGAMLLNLLALWLLHDGGSARGGTFTHRIQYFGGPSFLR